MSTEASTTTTTYNAPTATGPDASNRNGLGTAALVVGIIALLSCWTIIGGVVLGILAIVFGFIGRGRANRGEATNGGLAVAGLTLGVVGLVVAIVIVAITGSFLINHKKQINNLNNCLKNASTQSAKNSCDQQFQNSVNGNG
jgi:heme/copper-type cytochrome/quinol oxidase subunit 2